MRPRSFLVLLTMTDVPVRYCLMMNYGHHPWVAQIAVLIFFRL
jgi:hypothetical protein